MAGASTIVFILWHTLALLPVRDILSYTFSCEWSYQFSRTGTLIPGMTDRVSTLTAGQWDRLRYCCGRGASLHCRIAFATSLVFIILAGLAPGISIATQLTQQSMKLEIGKLAVSYQYFLPHPYLRAGLIAQLERIEKSQFGYQNQPNWIVAWPPLGLPSNGSGAIEYPSDVVRFEHSCQWEAPTWQNVSSRASSLYGVNGTSLWYYDIGQDPYKFMNGGQSSSLFANFLCP